MRHQFNGAAVSLPHDIISTVRRELVAFYFSESLGPRRQRRLAICIAGLAHLEDEAWTDEKLEAFLRLFSATTGGAFLRLAVARRTLNQALPHAAVGSGVFTACAMFLFASGWVSSLILACVGLGSFLLLSRLFRSAMGLIYLEHLSHVISLDTPITLDVPAG